MQVNSFMQKSDLKQFKLAKKCDLPDNFLIEFIIKFDKKIIYVAREGDIRRFYQESKQNFIQMQLTYKTDIIVFVCNVQENMKTQEYLVVIQKQLKNNEVHLDIYNTKEQIPIDTMQLQLSSNIVSAFQLKKWVVIIEQNSVIHLSNLETLAIIQFDELKQQNDILRDAFIRENESIYLFYDQGFRIIEFDHNDKLIDRGYQKIYNQYKQVFNFLGGIILLDMDGGIQIMNYTELAFRKYDYQSTITNIVRIFNFENSISKFAFFEDIKSQQSNFQQNQTHLKSTGLYSNQSKSFMFGQVSVCQIDNGQIQQILQIQNDQKCDYIYQDDAEIYYIGSNNTIYTLEKQNQIIVTTYKQLEDKSLIIPVKRATNMVQLDKYPKIEQIKALQVPKNLHQYLNENDRLSTSQENNNFVQTQYNQYGQYQQTFNQQIPSQDASQIGQQIQNLIVERIKLSRDIIYLQYKNYVFICDDTCSINQTVLVQDMISFLPHNDYLYVASLFNNEDFKIRIYGIEKQEEISLKPSIKYSLKGKPNQEDGILKKNNNIITVATYNGYMTKIDNSKLEEQQICQYSIDQVLFQGDKIITLSNSRLIQSYDLKRVPLKKVEVQGIKQIEVYDDKHLLVLQSEQIFSLLLLTIDDFKIKKTINIKEEIEKIYCYNKFIYMVSNNQLSVISFDEEIPNSKVQRHQYNIQLLQIYYFSWEDSKLLISDGIDIQIFSIQ